MTSVVMTGRDRNPAVSEEALVQGALRPGADRHRARRRSSAGCCPTSRRRLDQAARRRLHQADQDDHRADHLLTVVSGIARMQDARKVGRVGVKALVYFVFVSTLALVIGLIVGNVVQPGAGFAAASLDAGGGRRVTPSRPSDQKSVDFVLHIIPDTVVGAFAQRRHPAGAAVRHPVRLRADGAGRARPRGARRSSTMSRTRCSASSPSS